MSKNDMSSTQQMGIVRRINSSLTAKSTLAMIFVAVLPLLVVGIVSNVVASNNLRTQSGESVRTVASQTADQISRTLIENVHLMQALANVESVYKEVEQANDQYISNDEEILANILAIDATWREAPDNSLLIQNAISDDSEINLIAHQLRDFQEQFPRHVEMFATDRYGALIGSTNRTSDYYQADEEWWQVAWNNGQGNVYIGDPELDESTGVTAVNIAVPLEDDGRVLGVLRTTLDIQEILDVVGNATFGETGHVAVFDRNGTIIFDAVNADMIGQPLAASIQEASNFDQANTGWFRADGQLGVDEIHGFAQATQVASIDAISELNWTILAGISSREALRAATATTQLQIIAAIIAVLFAIGLATILSRQLLGQVGYISQLFRQVEEGDLSARAPVLSEDELGQMALGLNGLLDQLTTLVGTTQTEAERLQGSIVKLLEEVVGVADGDLTIEAEVTTDVTGALADSFNFMIEQLRSIIYDVQTATLQVGSSANEVQTTTEYLAEGSETQAAQIIDTTAAIDEMSVSIQQVSENASLSAEVGQQATRRAKRGTKAVQDTIEGMSRIQIQVEETAKRIDRLGRSSVEISKIVQLISDIADRTSILALNASIQAAAAGDAGRGFAVVAEEVERLAERSTEATRQISVLTRTIQNETAEAVTSMDTVTREVVNGTQLAEEAGESLEAIQNVSNRLSELIQSISLAANQQARGSETIAQAMNDIASVTQQTASGTKQAAVSISNLAVLADNLRGSVSMFKLPRRFNEFEDQVPNQYAYQTHENGVHTRQSGDYNGRER